MPSALEHDFVDFLVMFGRHNIRPPHFASKVSYSASPQSFATCTRSAACCYVAIAMLFGQNRAEMFLDFEHPIREAALFYMCGVGWERQPSAARVQRTSISNRLLRLFSLFSHILVTCDEDAATVSLDSNPISGGERGTRHERTRDETRLNAALRSLVPRPAFAKKYRDCRADALL